MEWLYALERGDAGDASLESELGGRSPMDRKRILCVLERRQGFSRRAIHRHLGLSPITVRRLIAAFAAGGIDALLGRKPRPLKADDEALKKALFALLHEPPTLSGYNRTTWRMADLQECLATRGFPVCDDVIRKRAAKSS